MVLSDIDGLLFSFGVFLFFTLDILFPRVIYVLKRGKLYICHQFQLGRTFLEEFRFLSAAFPNAAGFKYNRYNTELFTSKINKANNFDFCDKI